MTMLGTPAAPKKPRKKKGEWARLRDDADSAFKHYVRVRDCLYKNGQFAGECITCGRKMVVCWWDGKQWRWNKNAQGGHYVSCGKFATRWDEYNVNLQCAHCNAFLDKEDMIKRYTKALKLKYGDETPGSLVIQGKMERRWSRAELRELIQQYTDALQFTLDHPEGL